MHPTINTGSQIVSGSIFGSAYLHERHIDEGHFHLGAEPRRTIDFEALLQALRCALSLRNCQGR